MDKSKRTFMYDDYKYGGLKVTHVQSFCNSLNIAWVQMFLIADDGKKVEALAFYFQGKYSCTRFLSSVK